MTTDQLQLTTTMTPEGQSVMRDVSAGRCSSNTRRVQ